VLQGGVSWLLLQQESRHLPASMAFRLPPAACPDSSHLDIDATASSSRQPAKDKGKRQRREHLDHRRRLQPSRERGGEDGERC